MVLNNINVCVLNPFQCVKMIILEINFYFCKVDQVAGSKSGEWKRWWAKIVLSTHSVLAQAGTHRRVFPSGVLSQMHRDIWGEFWNDKARLGDKLRVQNPSNVKENNYSPCFARHLKKMPWAWKLLDWKVLARSWKSSVHWQWWLLQIKFRPVWNRSWCLFTAHVWGPQWHCKAPSAIYK